MKKQYKELFSDIRPDEELLNSIINPRKNSSVKKYFIAAAACAVVCAIAVCYQLANDSVTTKSRVDIPIAYETRFQPESQKHIRKFIKKGNGKIKIDADVVIEGKKEDLKIYNASIKKFSEDKIIEILYGENGLYYGDKNNAGIFETRLGGFTFDVSIDIDASKKIVSKGNDYAEGCGFSYTEAKRLADVFIEKSEINNYRIKEGRIEKSFSPFYGNWRSGFYIFNYTQYADGFSVETVTSEIESSVASNLSIKIDNEGIVGLNMYGLDLKEKHSLKGDIISVEAAIDIIEKNIENLWLSEFAPIVEIRLEYILDKNDNNNIELVPCWHFCIDQTELKSLDIQTQRENDTNDLCVNAVTGEIYRVADRYPVYQTVEGLKSTWNK